jgi:hypothetical protein
MIRKSETKWMDLNKLDSEAGQVYTVIGQAGNPVHLEGWLIFPAGTTRVSVTICTEEPEAV